MKLALRILCGVTLALTLAALAFYLSGHLAQAGSMVDLSGKLAIATALIGMMIAAQRTQWRWLAALAAAVFLTLTVGPTSGLPALYFAGPLISIVTALVYSFRMGEPGPRYRIGDNGRIAKR